MPETCDLETDVVVVGYGGAGAAAAITAHDNGARVTLLEKMPTPGGNTAVSGGNIAVPRNPEAFALYLKTICFKTVEDEIIDTFVEGLARVPAWLRGLGGELRLSPSPPTFPEVPGAGDLDALTVAEKDTAYKGTVNVALWRLLAEQVEKRGIRVMLSTPAKELVRKQGGDIAGVMAESEGKDIAVVARRGVILTCGGFENDDAMKWDYLTPKGVQFCGSPGNTGDGIRMVQKVGAGLWHMTGQKCKIAFKAPGYEAAFAINFLAPSFIFVDQYGERFADEVSTDPHLWWIPTSEFNCKRFEYSRVPFYAVFDEEVARKGPLCFTKSGYVLVVDQYKWSSDNSQEIESGWIIRADSIAELAERISAPAEALENTIARYNAHCRRGDDSDFGRPRERLRVIEGPPYYAIQLWPALLNTSGGSRRDKESRVLDPYGNPVPRLYAAGEFGSIWGFRYQKSTSVSEALIFGQIAGRNAAAASPLAL